MDYCVLSKPTKYAIFLPSSRPMVPNRRRRVLISSCYGGSEFDSLTAPLKPRTAAGRSLTGVLLDDPNNIHLAARQELHHLAAHRDQTAARVQLSLGSHEACLHRRIADLVRQQCSEAVEEVMYTLILNEFLKTGVHLIPRLSKCICNHRLEILPSKEWELESVHTPEVLEMVRRHTTAVIGLQPNITREECGTIFAIQHVPLCKLYRASILYGYFLKGASLRHRLEWGLESSQNMKRIGAYCLHPVSEIFSPGSKDVMFVSNNTSKYLSQESYGENLWAYVLGFNPETIEMCAKPKSKEAAELIERHSLALFGDKKTNEVIYTSYASMKRFVLEGVALGSFLWGAENFVNNVYMLEENRQLC